MTRRRICVITGTRADYGILYWPMRRLQEHPDFELQVVATGSHLAPQFGSTYRTILDDGFTLAAQVDMALTDDTPVALSRSMGLATAGLGEAYARLQPNLVMFLGDRYEILAAAQAALIARIPMAHLGGGDVTAGAFDDAIRHSLTKMAHLHFVTHADAARRVQQLGEDPARIHVVGSAALDYLAQTPLLSRAEFADRYGIALPAMNLLVTYHPETLSEQGAEVDFAQLLTALSSLPESIGLLITGPNADPCGQRLRAMAARYVQERPHAWLVDSLGQQGYWSALAIVNAVVGNSSSGLYEAPSFRTPTVNIGNRQSGRVCAKSVITCPAETHAIRYAIDKALALDCSDVVNPYGDGHATERILPILQAIPDFRTLLHKRFVDRF
jgi:UDP-N-acetylglucosamine 2-epimerase (non-hydrolysing)/GDP/UDP-N,N'-diacetylbacillosamine 2-epimerase (hydrolysing)